MSAVMINDGSPSPYDQLFQEDLDNRILVLNDVIDDTIIDTCMLYILKWNREDKDIPKKKRQPIRLYLNSIGGDAFPAGQFCSLIEASETPIIGVAFDLVASAAYHIYIACHERIAFKNSVFLQHEGEIEAADSISKFRNLVAFYDTMEERFRQNVLDHTAMTEEYYNSVYTTELWIYADEARELGIVDKIIGEDCKLDEII